MKTYRFCLICNYKIFKYIIVNIIVFFYYGLLCRLEVLFFIKKKDNKLIIRVIEIEVILGFKKFYGMGFGGRFEV